MRRKYDSLLYGLIFTGLSMFSYLLLVNYTSLPERVSDAINTLGAFLFFVLTFNVVGYATIRISSWVNNQYSRNLRSRWKIIGIYAMVMLLFFLLNYGLLVLAKILAGVSQPFIFPNGGSRILIVVWLIELVILALLLANRSIQETLKFQQQAAELREENNKARYTALQNQLNPHFLFNSLNTLIAEIEYDPKNAIGFTKNLSNVYRYVLQAQDKPLVTLLDELDFMKAYLFLHEVRLGNCIYWHSKIPADFLEYRLPPLTLQLLVENIFKHNTISQRNPVKIEIEIEQESLKVSNSINLKKNKESCGIGLKNLSNRCKLIMRKEIAVSNDNGIFTVVIPLLYE
ncbi:MAG: histidine kinase [Bacteroidales bacterium]